MVVLGGWVPLWLLGLCRVVACLLTGVIVVVCFGVASFADLVAALMNFHVLLMSDDCGE